MKLAVPFAPNHAFVFAFTRVHAPLASRAGEGGAAKDPGDEPGREEKTSEHPESTLSG